ncbi:FMN-linked oxidoreductase [Gymnopus androsaceus JB14]|uniref:tRNA-dihydrouridine(47) synthase [NAD(P)(+)] n=1 Tax=Gymnopus androsaceus JB14 TaxID=1447944 RepID=A0A6A4HW34_9AGAR|nr:FMN-linked oxidoreductase [Gymnopus androsaceus JB14]
MDVDPTAPTPSRPPGTAAVKAEYIISDSADGDTFDDDAVEGETGPSTKRSRDDRDDDSSNKKPKLSKAEKKAEKKARQGQNKNRKFGKVRDGDDASGTATGATGVSRDDVFGKDLCFRVASGGICEYTSGEKGCKFSHDIEGYLKTKPRDLRFPGSVDEALRLSSVALDIGSSKEGEGNEAGKEKDSETQHGETPEEVRCPVFSDVGFCKAGFKCRYLGAHCTVGEDGKHVLVDASTMSTPGGPELNHISPHTQKLLRTKKYATPISDSFLEELKEGEARVARVEREAKAAREAEAEAEAQVDRMVGEAEGEVSKQESMVGDAKEAESKMDADAVEASKDTPDVPVRWVEKNRLNWEGKTYLAPLTTVGNLPFRRLCVSYGADITCGEMSLAPSLLSGSSPEWSLVRRHPSEKTFGVQVAGGKPGMLVRVGEVLGRELGGLANATSNPVLGGGSEGSNLGTGARETGIDFVDINCGCPIDLVFKSGSGSALLDAPAKLGKSLIGMNKALGPIPVTIKLRMGVKDGKNTAEKIMLRAVSDPVQTMFGLGNGKEEGTGTERGLGWGVGGMTLHGRTRQQRYTKLADWEYIKQCVEAVRAREEEEGLPPIPIFGNGDIYSAYAYHTSLRLSGATGIMLARGALIKPWIFTEIKEHREWDISSRERLEGVRRLAEWGLSHFGSDTSGVNTTRRYLCEALSFQYRYVPIGLLEVLPPSSGGNTIGVGWNPSREFGSAFGDVGVDTGGYGRMGINERPPRFRGRDELETLLASPSSSTWVKISEMFLGPAPDKDKWSFVPKHKSNSFESQG